MFVHSHRSGHGKQKSRPDSAVSGSFLSLLENIFNLVMHDLGSQGLTVQVSRIVGI